MLLEMMTCCTKRVLIVLGLTLFNFYLGKVLELDYCKVLLLSVFGRFINTCSLQVGWTLKALSNPNCSVSPQQDFCH